MFIISDLRRSVRQSWWGKILAELDTEPHELSGGLLKIVIGAQLIGPWSTFGSSPAYADLAILPEFFWGWFLIAIGVAHLLALRSGYLAWRRWACFGGFVIWFSFGATFVHANPTSLGWVVFAYAGAWQLWAHVRLGRKQKSRNLVAAVE